LILFFHLFSFVFVALLLWGFEALGFWSFGENIGFFQWLLFMNGDDGDLLLNGLVY